LALLLFGLYFWLVASASGFDYRFGLGFSAGAQRSADGAPTESAIAAIWAALVHARGAVVGWPLTGITIRAHSTHTWPALNIYALRAREFGI
jgi:hypothetical protein